MVTVQAETPVGGDKFSQAKQWLEAKGYKMLGANGSLAVGESYDTAGSVGTLWRNAQQSDDVGNKLWVMATAVNERGRRIGRIVRQIMVHTEGDGQYQASRWISEYRDYETDELLATVTDGDIEFDSPPNTVPFTKPEAMPDMPVDRYNLTRYLKMGYSLNPPNSMETGVTGIVVENPLLAAPLAGFEGTEEERLGALVESELPGMLAREDESLSPTELAVRHLANLDANVLEEALARARESQPEQTAEAPPQGEVEDQTDEQTPVACDEEDCDKSYSSTRGLKIHKSRAHPPGD